MPLTFKTRNYILSTPWRACVLAVRIISFSFGWVHRSSRNGQVARYHSVFVNSIGHGPTVPTDHKDAMGHLFFFHFISLGSSLHHGQ